MCVRRFPISFPKNAKKILCVYYFLSFFLLALLQLLLHLLKINRHLIHGTLSSEIRAIIFSYISFINLLIVFIDGKNKILTSYYK